MGVLGGVCAGTKIRAESAEAKLEMLCTELAEAQAAVNQLDEVSRQLHAKEEAAAALQAALAQKDERLPQQDIASADLADAIIQINSLQTSLRAKENQLASLQTEIAQLRATTGELETAKAEMEAVAAECNEVKAALEAKAGACTQLEAQVSRASGEAVSAREAADQLRQKNMQLDLQLERATQQLAASEDSRCPAGLPFVPYDD